MPDPIETLLGSLPGEIQSISRALRQMAKEAIPSAHEFVYHGAINYGPSLSPAQRFCYIAPQTHHVNLGFFYGTYLPDPQHLLVGTGKRMRHVKVRSLEEASNPHLRDLLTVAWSTGDPRAAAS